MSNHPRKRKRFQLKPRTRQKQIQKRIITCSLIFLFGTLGILIFLNSRSENAYAAINYTWTGTGGTDWNTSTSWSPVGVPTSGDNVTIGAAANQPELNSNITVNNFTTNAGAQPNLKSYTLTIGGNAILNGGTIVNSGLSGTLTAQGSSATFGNSTGGPIINVPLTINTSNFTLRSTTFNATTSLKKNGAGNDNSYGNNTFNGVTTITNNSSSQILFSNNMRDVFNDDVTFINSGTSCINSAYNDASGTQFNGNILVNSISGTGILFGGNSGTITLAPTKTISVGASGFSSGILSLRHFTYSGTDDLVFNLTGSSGITYGPISSFGGGVTSSSASLLLNGCTFGGITSFTKTGSTNDQSIGNNTFSGASTFTNTGTGYIMLGNSGADIFNSTAVFNNNGSSDFYIAHNTAGNQFNGTTTINNAISSGTHAFYITEGNAAATAAFNGDVIVTNSGPASNSLVRFNLRGTTAFNGNITINNTVGNVNSYGIFFGWPAYAGSATLVASKTISVGSTGFTGGTLGFNRFTQNGTAAVNLNLSGTAGLTINPYTIFGGDFSSTSATLYLNGGTFAGTTSFTKTGSTNDVSTGGNTFSGACTLTNTGSGYVLMGNTNPDIFSSDATFTNSGTSDFYIAHASAGNQFNGDVIINNTGSSTNRFYVTEGATISTAVFNGGVTINNTGTGNSSYVRLNLKGTDTFNGNIVINSTAGISGIYGVYFGWSGNPGSATITSGNTISLGALGFTTGELSLINFSQSGNASMNINLSSTATLTFGPTATIGGNLIATCGSLYLNGCSFGGTTSITKYGSANNTCTGGNTFSGTSTITNNSSGNLILGNTNRDLFGEDAIFTNSGTAFIYLAHNSPGNQFNGNVTLNNTGSGSDNRILVCEGAAAASAEFNGTVTANNAGTASTSYIRFNLRGTDTFNGDIILNSTAGTGTNIAGIYFGWSGYNGTASLAAEKNISIGPTGYTRGDLSLIKFSQAGSAAVSLTLPSTVALTLGPSSALGGNVTATCGSLYLNGCSFGGTTSFTKTGASNNTCIGGNTFTGNSTITNSGTANLVLGNSSPDVFNGNTTFNNSGSGYFYLADNTAGNQFNGTTTFNNNGTGTDIRMFVCEGAAVSSATFNGDVTANNTGTATDGFIRFNLRGICNFNGNIVVNSTLGTASNYGIDFGWPGYNGTSILSSGKTITTGVTGFTKGNLFLQNLTQTGNTSQAIVLGGTSILTFGSGSVISGNITASSPTVLFNGTTFNGTTTVTKTGNTNDVSTGNNTFNGPFTLVNNSSGNITLSNSNKDTYNDNVTFTNTSSGIIYPAYNDASGTLFNGDIFLNNTGSGSIRFGQNNGTCILASGGTLGAGVTGFTSGDLYIRKFTQQGSTTQSMSVLSGTSSLYIQTGTAFNGATTFSFPQIFLNGATFNGTTVLEKNGATNNTSMGANTFNSTTTISNKGTGNFILANSTADDFNGNVTFTQTGTGLLQPAYNTNCTFSKNISTIGSLSVITFGSSAGRVTIDGSTGQTISGSASLLPVFTRMSMATTGSDGNLTLNVPLTLTTNLTLNSGKIITGTNELKVTGTAAASVTGHSSSSYIIGNLRRSISSSGTYDFPVGNDSNYELATLVLSSATGFTDIIGKFTPSLPVLSSLPLLGVLLGTNLVTNMLNSGYWTMTPNNPMTGGSYSITLNSRGQTNGNTNAASYCVLKRSNALSGWQSLGAHTNGTQSISNGVVTAVRSALTSFSDFGEGYYGGGSLPIKLIYFNADLTIERSADGQAFQPILTKPGAGNSTNDLYYSSEDVEPLKGYSYYRLKQTDFDGHYSYSEIVTVKNGEGGGSSQLDLESVAPNPFSESFKVSFLVKAEVDVEFILMNSGGTIIKDEKIKTQEGYNTYEFRDDANLNKGIYFLTVLYEDQKLIQKIIKE